MITWHPVDIYYYKPCIVSSSRTFNNILCSTLFLESPLSVGCSVILPGAGDWPLTITYIPQLLGLLLVCGTDPKVYYAWKLFLIKSWRAINDLEEGFCSYKESFKSLLDSSTYLLALWIDYLWLAVLLAIWSKLGFWCDFWFNISHLLEHKPCPAPPQLSEDSDHELCNGE